MSRTLLFVVFGVIFCVSTYAAEFDSPRQFSKFHSRWAQSLAGSTPQLLFVVNEHELGDAHEIAWQIDANSVFEVVESGERFFTESDLLRSDAFIVSVGVWNNLADGDRQSFLDRVKEGSGLVLLETNADSNDGLLTVPYSLLPTPASLNPDVAIPPQVLATGTAFTWKVGSHGQGRVAYGVSPASSLHHGLIPVTHLRGIDARLPYDYHVGQVIRALLWAVAFDAPARIKKLERLEEELPSAEEIPPQIPAKYMQYMNDVRLRSTTGVFQLQLTEPASVPLSVSLRVRHPFRDVQWEVPELLQIPKGATQVHFYLPLGRGDACIDLWLSHKNDVSDWASIGIYANIWPMLEEVAFSKTLVSPNDSIEVEFSVRQNLFTPAQTFAHLVLRDTFDRVVAFKVVPVNPNGNVVKARFGWTDALTASLKLDIYLLENAVGLPDDWYKRQASYAGTQLVVERPTRSGLHWILNDMALNEPESYRRFRELSALGLNGLVVGNAAWVDTAAIESNLDTIVTFDAFSRISPDAATTRVPCLTSLEWQQAQYERAADWSVWARTHGVAYTMLLEPEGIPAFSDACDSATCRAAFRSDLQRYYPNLDALNRSWQSNYATWGEIDAPVSESPHAAEVDYFRSRMDIHARAYADVSGYLREFDAGIHSAISLSAPTPVFSPLMALSQLNVALASPVSLAKLRSYSSFNARVGVQIGSDDFGNPAQWPWRSVFNRMEVIQTPEPVEMYAGNTLSEFSESLSAIRDGYDTLLLQAKTDSADVAVYENAASLHASDKEGRQVMQARQSRLVDALREGNLLYDFVSYEQLMETGLSRYALVLIPHAPALSAEEIAIFERFEKDGGVLGVSEGTGVLNEHGVVAPDQFKVRAASNWSIDDEVNLAETLSELSKKLHLPTQAPALKKSLQSDARVDWFRFHYGAATIVAAIREPDGRRVKPELVLADGHWAYDMIAGELLSVKKPRLQFDERGVGLVSMLPYRVSRLILDGPNVLQAGQRLSFSVEVKTFDALPEEHWILVRLRDPNEESIEYYRTQIACVDGKGRAYIPIALNETPGRYTLEVRDVLTGMTATKSIDILR
ncbi:MAG: alpha-amylase family protein [Candidatus Hydrogenedentota bacterium]